MIIIIALVLISIIIQQFNSHWDDNFLWYYVRRKPKRHHTKCWQRYPVITFIIHVNLQNKIPWDKIWL